MSQIIFRDFYCEKCYLQFDKKNVYNPVISKSVFRYRKVPFYPTNIDNVSFYGKFIHIDIDAQY